MTEAPLKILIAVDDSAESRQAVDAAWEFFGPDPDYTVLSAGDPNPAVIACQVGHTFTSAAALRTHLDDSIKAMARGAVERATDQLPTEADTATVLGSAGPVICRVAEDLDSDLIVIGSHDKSFWARLIDPSVGRYLMDHASCPVLVVR